MVSGQNGCVHRVLSSILSRRFDLVERSPRSLEFSIFFQPFFGHFRVLINSLALKVLNIKQEVE